MFPSALQFLIVMIACSLNAFMQKALDFKSEEVVILKGILREVTKQKRIDFTEDQRARLALLGKSLSAKERRESCEIVKPKTIVDWFRRIHSAEYSSRRRRHRGSSSHDRYRSNAHRGSAGDAHRVRAALRIASIE